MRGRWRLLAAIVVLASSLTGCALLAQGDTGEFAQFGDCDALRLQVRNIQANEFSWRLPEDADLRARQLGCSFDDFRCFANLATHTGLDGNVDGGALERCLDIAPEQNPAATD